MSAHDPELETLRSPPWLPRTLSLSVVGGFAVIANRFVRATEDIDFLVPDDAENDRQDPGGSA